MLNVDGHKFPTQISNILTFMNQGIEGTNVTVMIAVVNKAMCLRGREHLTVRRTQAQEKATCNAK